jgi:hypothetical protein
MKQKNFLKTIPAVLVCAAFLAAVVTGCDNGLLENPASRQSGQAKNGGVQTTRYIRTAADMANIGVGSWLMSDDYILAANITLSDWTPIGTDTAPFTGTFDGGGNTITITGFSSTALDNSDYLGIFGYVGDATALTPAGISNLTVVSEIDDSTKRLREQEIGALVGHAINATIANITLEGSLSYTSVNKDVYAGGIAGFLDAGVVFSECATSGRVTVTIAGGGGGNSALVPGQYNTFVGGLAGLFRNGVQIEDCHYTGDITATVVSDAAFAGPIAGGITGGTGLDFATDKPSDGYIADSSFSGTINAYAPSGSYTGVGGIAGTLQGGDNTPEGATRAIRCSATGTLSNADTSTGWPFIGGIVGYNYMGGWVDQCYFDGTITSNKNGMSGGIAGFNTNYSGKISGVQNCHVGGSIGSANAIGGIDENGAIVRYCYITAAFSGSLDKGCLQPDGTEDQAYYEDQGFDFTTVWKMPSTPTPHYPLLQWE